MSMFSVARALLSALLLPRVTGQVADCKNGSLSEGGSGPRCVDVHEVLEKPGGGADSPELKEVRAWTNPGAGEDAPEWAKVNGVDKVSDERWCERAYNVVICEGRLHEPGRDRPVQTMYMRNFQEVFGLDCGDASPDELHRRAGECEQVNGAW